jgi:FkbM family methyltransferase
MLVEMDLRKLRDQYNLKIKGIIQVGSYLVSEYEILKEVCSGKFIFIDANKNVTDKLQSKIDEGCLVFNNLVSDVDDQEQDFYILNHEQSSSMLKLDKHAAYHPEYSKIVEERKIKTTTLDTLIKLNNINILNYNCLVMDVQGSELHVLKGFNSGVGNIDYVYTELNFESMYQGCALEKDLTEYLNDKGFTLVESFNTGFGWGDGLYIKNSLL